MYTIKQWSGVRGGRTQENICQFHEARMIETRVYIYKYITTNHAKDEDVQINRKIMQVNAVNLISTYQIICFRT